MRDLQDWHKKVEHDARSAQRALEQMRRTAELLPAASSTDRTSPSASSRERDLDLSATVPSAPETVTPRRPLARSVRTADGGLNRGSRSRTAESREELISRLLDPTLTLEETARVLEVCPTTVRRYTNKGLLPHERSKGNQRRFKLSAVLAFLESQGMPADRRDEER